MRTSLIVSCISLAGSFGGLLYSIKEKKISLPCKKGLTIELGVINDLFFGFGGGFLIFLVLPEFPNTEEAWGIVKLLSLSIAGGYSGRALIEKVANEQLKSIVTQMKKTNDANQKAYKMFSEIVDGKYINIESIRENLKDVSQATLLRGFVLLNDRRENLVLKLIEINNDKGPIEKSDEIKRKFESFMPLLIAIIEREEGDRKLEGDDGDTISFLHYHYAVLAYLFKDIVNPKWGETLKYIDIAISLYKKVYNTNSVPETYMLNKLLSHINLYEEKNAVLAFEQLWKNSGGKYEILRSESVLAPKLHSWIRNLYKEEVRNYAEHNYHAVCRVKWWNQED